MRVLIVANNDVGLYKFRRELIEALLAEHEVHICLPQGEYIEKLSAMGCVYHACEFDRHGMNPLAEFKQLSFYKKILKNIAPDIVFTYTIKPNIYAGMACASMKIPYVVNITGLGTAIENGGFKQKLLLMLYKRGLRKAKKVFFQNTANRDFMVEKGVVKDRYELLPGSGVNLVEHKEEAYPEQQTPIVFVTVGRIMTDKGSNEILYAAKAIRKENPNVIFRLIGGFDEGDVFQDKIKEAVENGDIEFLGRRSDVHDCIKQSHAIIHASYHEGMSNVLLEAAACARPIIATDVAGCKETYEVGVSGISCKARDGEDLVRAIREFIELPYEQKIAMGKAGRKKAENEFDRTIVIRKYMEEIKEIR